MLPDATYLGITGSRKVDQETRRLYHKFVLQVLNSVTPIVIIGGLAEGIDRAGHVAALKADVPTVGVLPTPINIMYPYENTDVATRMWSKDQLGNAVVSEYAPVSSERDAPFEPLARNRIIAGASKALLLGGVSQRRSGSLNTARLAFEQERPVFFVKGTVSDSVRQLLMGTYKAVEVSEPQPVIEALQR